MFQYITRYLFPIDFLANSFLNIKYKSQIYSFQFLRKKSSIVILMSLVDKMKHTNGSNNAITFLIMEFKQYNVKISY